MIIPINKSNTEYIDNYNIFILNNFHISPYETIILKSLNNFYSDDKNVNKVMFLISLLNSTSSISIRLIDYFITHYVKVNKLVINNFNVYISYKQQLKLYQKKFFDPFSRGIRLPYFLNNKCFITTIGQLNFFKWLLYNNIHQYIIDHQHDIETIMLTQYRLKPIKSSCSSINYLKNISSNKKANISSLSTPFYLNKCIPTYKISTIVTF